VGRERIANELLLKLGIRLSPRTVRRGRKHGAHSYGTTADWSSRASVTATFRVVYVFVGLEVGTRRILHWNVTADPTARWTAQQFSADRHGDQVDRFVIHDRDTIYSEGVDPHA